MDTKIVSAILISTTLGALIGFSSSYAFFNAQIQNLQTELTALNSTVDEISSRKWHLATSYMVYIDDSTVYMKNGSSQKIEWSSVNASAVFNACVGNLTNGGKILVKAGTYLGHLTINNDNIQIEGEEQEATIIKLPEGANIDVINVQAYGCTISNLKVDGNKDHNTNGNGIKINGSMCRVLHVRIDDVPEDGIHLARTMGTKIHLSTVSGAERYGMYLAHEATDCEIIDNLLRSPNYDTDTGIAIDGSANIFMANHIWGSQVAVKLAPEHTVCRIILVSNYIENVFQHGILANSCGVWESLINDNTFWWSSRDNVGTYDSIYVDLSGDYRFSRVSISGNVFLGTGLDDTPTTRYAIHASNWRFQNNAIQGNVIRGYTGTPVINIPGGQNNIVTGNIGFVTENSGVTEASNDDWVPHGLDGEPDTVILNLEKTDARYTLQLKATNATHFQIYLYDDTTGGLETTDKTIHWYAEYKP